MTMQRIPVRTLPREERGPFPIPSRKSYVSEKTFCEGVFQALKQTEGQALTYRDLAHYMGATNSNFTHVAVRVGKAVNKLKARNTISYRKARNGVPNAKIYRVLRSRINSDRTAPKVYEVGSQEAPTPAVRETAPPVEPTSRQARQLEDLVFEFLADHVGNTPVTELVRWLRTKV